ncbi:hypothetical protein J3F84DRAFT_358663 [Trichoderma pleuroticola]
MFDAWEAKFFLYIYLTYIVMSRFVQPLWWKREDWFDASYLQHSKLGLQSGFFLRGNWYFFSIIIVIAK